MPACTRSAKIIAAIAEPALTLVTARGASGTRWRSASINPTCQRQRQPPPAKTIASNIEHGRSMARGRRRALCATLPAEMQVWSKLPLLVELGVPYIDDVAVSGSSELKVLGFDSESLAVRSSGSSDILLRGSADSLELASSGSSDIRIELEDSDRVLVSTSGSSDISVCGDARELTIESSGSSDVHAHTLVAQDVEVQSSGSSDIVVCARDSLYAAISGSGDVTYLCNPQSVRSDVSGSGDISPG